MCGWLGLLHQLMAIPLHGLVPLDYPPGGPEAHCCATLAFLCLSLGWLLPVHVALRWHCGGRAERRPERAAPSPRAAHPCSSSDSSGGSLRRAPARWVLSNVFLAGESSELQVRAWCSLLSSCWLAATLFAAWQEET